MRTLRVATHNVCHMGFNPIDHTELFPDGTYRNGYEAKTVEMMERYWTEVYSSFSADLIGMQEYSGWFDLANTIRSKELFRKFGYRVHDKKTGLVIATTLPAENVYERRFEPVSQRRLQKYYVELDGRKIAVFNSHPSPKGENTELRQKEYAMLIEEFRNEEYFISFGDYNARTAGEYRCFEEAGFPMANTGIGTVRKYEFTCDNVIVSPNLKLGNVSLFDRECLLSDHRVLYAEVTFPWEAEA